MPQRNTMHFLCLRGESFLSASLSLSLVRLLFKGERKGHSGCEALCRRCTADKRVREREREGKKEREAQETGESLMVTFFLSFTLGLSLCSFPFHFFFWLFLSHPRYRSLIAAS